MKVINDLKESDAVNNFYEIYCNCKSDYSWTGPKMFNFNNVGRAVLAQCQEDQGPWWQETGLQCWACYRRPSVGLCQQIPVGHHCKATAGIYIWFKFVFFLWGVVHSSGRLSMDELCRVRSLNLGSIRFNLNCRLARWMHNFKFFIFFFIWLIYTVIPLHCIRLKLIALLLSNTIWKPEEMLI